MRLCRWIPAGLLRRARFVALIPLVAMPMACDRGGAPAEAEKQELATVEVTAAPDAALSTADDRIERRADANAMAGALPDGFPPDIPVYRPSSLVDFAARPEGGYRVAFASPSEASTVRSAMTGKLAAAGWQAGAPGDWTKAGRRLRLTVESSAAGSRFHLEF